jgi:hypothetical protein
MYILQNTLFSRWIEEAILKGKHLVAEWILGKEIIKYNSSIPLVHKEWEPWKASFDSPYPHSLFLVVIGCDVVPVPKSMHERARGLPSTKEHQSWLSDKVCLPVQTCACNPVAGWRVAFVGTSIWESCLALLYRWKMWRILEENRINLKIGRNIKSAERNH